MNFVDGIIYVILLQSFVFHLVRHVHKASNDCWSCYACRSVCLFME